jgi:hypothetical protein
LHSKRCAPLRPADLCQRRLPTISHGEGARTNDKGRRSASLSLSNFNLLKTTTPQTQFTPSEAASTSIPTSPHRTEKLHSIISQVWTPLNDQTKHLRLAFFAYQFPFCAPLNPSAITGITKPARTPHKTKTPQL